MWSHPFPYLHIKVCKIALSDADIFPINPVGMREMHSSDAGIVIFDGSASPYACASALGSHGLFTNNVLGRLVLANALKRCLSNAIAVCPAAEIDLDHHLRLHPNRFSGALLFCRDRLKWRLGCLDGLELTIKRARHFVCKTRPGAPCVFEFIAIIDTEHPRADGACVSCRGYQARNDEFLTIRAFGLDPFMRTPGVIRSVGQF